jgi:hypothetical protein
MTDRVTSRGALDQSRISLVQRFRNRAETYGRLRDATTVKPIKDRYAASARQWHQLAEDAEQIERNYRAGLAGGYRRSA